MKKSNNNRVKRVKLVAAALKENALFWWLLATVIFTSITFVIMGDAITSCSTTIFGYPGDGTGGLAWFQWADKGGPIWGYTNLSNYPFGEQLNRPSFITAYGLYAPYSILAMLTNQICGLNIMTAIGFISTALLMFGLTRWLTGINGVAIFSGIAAAFVPFHQLQAQGHLSYVYSSFFVAILWAFLWFSKKPSLRRALLIGLLYVATLYSDGYFILMSTAMVVVLFLIFLFTRVVRIGKNHSLTIDIDARQLKRNVQRHWKILLLTILGVAIMLAPIAYKQIRQGDEIQSGLANARSNIYNEAKAYGTYIEDFFLPSIRSVFVNNEYVNWRVANIHGSNQQENTLYIGYTVIAFMLIAVGGIYFTKRFTKDDNFNQYKYVLKVALVLIVALTLISLPPYISLWKIELPTPTLFLIEITEKWRVLSRFFMITHIAMVLVASIGLALLYRSIKSYKKYVLLGLAIFLISLEFYPVNNQNWSYEKDTPNIYHRIAKDDSIRVLAEYPIIDHPSPTLPYTFTFQQTHGKPILNANNASTNQRYLRQSIAGLADVQTIGVLKQLGIDTVTTLGINAGGVNGLTEYMPASKIIDPSIENVYSYRVSNQSPRQHALIVRDGFTTQLSTDRLKSRQYMINSGNMQISPVGKGVANTGKQFMVNFTANAHEDGAQKLEIRQHEKVIWSGVVQKNTRVEFTADDSNSIRLFVPGYYNTPALYVEDMSVTPL